MTSPRARGVLKPLLPKTSSRPRGPPVTYKDLLPSPTSPDTTAPPAPQQQGGGSSPHGAPSSQGLQRHTDPREITPSGSAQPSRLAEDQTSARKVKSMMSELELM